MNRRIDKVMNELAQLMEDQKELFEALPRAIRIAQVWPDAFKDGLACSPILVGTNYPENQKSKIPYPKPYHRVRDIKRTYLQRKDGTKHDITIDDFFSIISAGPE